MRDSIRHFLAEFIGVFALVFIGGATILVTRGTDGLLAIALAHGLTLGILLGSLVARLVRPVTGVGQILGIVAIADPHFASP